jgi:outer membrane receptor for ferrienterochelin and colicins
MDITRRVRYELCRVGGGSMARTRPFVVTVVAVGALAVLGAGPVSSQEGAIAGTVTDSVGGRPIGDVEVTIRTRDDEVVAVVRTDGTGVFRATPMPAGSYTILFRSLGWEPTDRVNVRVVAGRTTELSVQLVPRPIVLPGVSTVARSSQPILEAVASVSVRDRNEIERRPQITLLDQVRSMPGLDVIRTGLTEGQMITRGFNRLFNTRLLLLTDGRMTHVPSVRTNPPSMLPVTSLDLERIELVRGPASALWGPDAADGVLQVFTRSPLDDPGVAFAVSGGVRDQGAVEGFGASAAGLLELEGRVALAPSDRWGVKLSGRWFRGTEWRHVDPVEDSARREAAACLDNHSPANPACQSFVSDPDAVPDSGRLARIGRRDFLLEHGTLDARVDWVSSDRATLSVSTGLGWSGSGIAQTGAGATQVQEAWTGYGQVRLRVGELATQAYVSHSVLDDAYDLRTGFRISDRSTLVAAQLQHGIEVAKGERLVYGSDAQLTLLDPEVPGIYSDADDFHIVGAFLQSETDLSRRWRLVAAGRMDMHSVLPEAVVSPRIALVVEPASGHSVRATYNRAFTTPLPNALFVDRSAGRMHLVGPYTYGLRAQGSGGHGFAYTRIDGRPAMKSPLAPLTGAYPEAFLPSTTEQLYILAREYLRSIGATGAAVMDAVGVPAEADVAVVLRSFDGDVLPGGFSSISDVAPLEQEGTTTIEVGYRGVLGGRVQLSADAYHTRKSGFIAPSWVSPIVSLDGEALADFFRSRGVDEASAQALAVGTPEEPGISRLPLGVVTPRGVSDPGPTLLRTTRNFGDVELFGIDLSLDLRLNERWNAGWDVAVVSDDAFDAEGLEIALNAPSFKSGISVQRRSPDGFDVSAHYRFTRGYPALSGVHQGRVDGSHVVDLGFGYRIPGHTDVRMQLDVQNLFGVSYRTFVGAPRIGRVVIARMVWRN